MGQYYRAVCVDKQEYLTSWQYGSGAKLMEHSWGENPFVKSVARLLMPGGAWHKKRLVWAGDYGDDGLFIDHDIINKNSRAFLSALKASNQEDYESVINKERPLSDFFNLYWVSSEYFKKRPISKAKKLRSLGSFFVNHSKKEFFEFGSRTMLLDKLAGDGDWHIHPLPLLVCNGNGRGGGDYGREDEEGLVGSWAGDIISLERKSPDSFEQIYPDFRE